MQAAAPNNQTEGLAHSASYTSAGTIVTFPATEGGWAKFVCRHIGSSGKWYGKYGGGSLTTSNYDFVLDPGDPEQKDNPTEGDVKILASGSSIGDLEWSASYRT